MLRVFAGIPLFVAKYITHSPKKQRPLLQPIKLQECPGFHSLTTKKKQALIIQSTSCYVKYKSLSSSFMEK